VFENLSRNQRKDLKEALELAQRRSRAPWSPSGWTNPLASVVNRRAFLKGGAGLIGGAVVGKTLAGLSVRRALAAQPCSAGGAERLALERADSDCRSRDRLESPPAPAGL
jgi:hypothetical protein